MNEIIMSNSMGKKEKKRKKLFYVSLIGGLCSLL